MTGQGSPFLKDTQRNIQKISLVTDNLNNISVITQDAIQQVENNQLDRYFELMDQIVPKSESHTYSRLKQSFLADKAPSSFEQKLKVFAREIDRLK